MNMVGDQRSVEEDREPLPGYQEQKVEGDVQDVPAVGDEEAKEHAEGEGGEGAGVEGAGDEDEGDEGAGDEGAGDF